MAVETIDASSLLTVSSILALLAAMAVIAIIVAIALYVYTAFVWMTIAKKLKYKKSWLAWIPIANMFLIPILAKKDWTWGFIFLVPIVNVVFVFIWTWNIFEQRKFPGWLSLIPLLTVIPYVGGLAAIAYLAVLGIVAWSK